MTFRIKCPLQHQTCVSIFLRVLERKQHSLQRQLLKTLFFLKHQTQSTSHVFYFTCKGPHMLLVAFHDT